MTPDLDRLTRLAHAATQGGRTIEPHWSAAKMMTDDDGDWLLLGNATDIELAAALTPDVVLWLVEMARRVGAP